MERQNRNGIWARWLKNAFAPAFKGRFHFVAGNPPWINWESLSDEYRKATRRLWQKYGLFSLKGHEARLGGGKKDFSMLFTYAACDNYLEDGHRLGFLITQTVFQTKGAGAGFRRFALGSGTPLRVLKAEDLVEVKPFEGASNWSGMVVIEKGQATKYPVKYTKWVKKKGSVLTPESTVSEALGACERTDYLARPVSNSDSSSPWQVLSHASVGPLQKVAGQSQYRAKAGITTWLDGVFWLSVLEQRPDGLLVVQNHPEKGKTALGQPVTVSVEPDFVYPFVRWEDIDRFSWKAAHCILVTQDPDTRTGFDEQRMKTEFPHSYEYLRRFEKELRARSGFRKYFDPRSDAFYSVYNVSRDNFAPIKVVWKTMGSRIEAAVLTELSLFDLPLKVPFHKNTVMFVPLGNLEEAHYLAAVLNSAIVTLFAKSHSVSGGKSFGASNLLAQIAIPRFNSESALHVELAGLSRRAHELAASISDSGNDALAELSETQNHIDRAAAHLWGLTAGELDSVCKALGIPLASSFVRGATPS